MISLPDVSKNWEYENGYFLTAQNTRFFKFLAQYELYKLTKDVEGSIVECGVFKGASFMRFAAFRELSEIPKKLIGFDTFGAFPQAHSEGDESFREKWVKEAGAEAISRQQLQTLMEQKGVWNDVELIEGDVAETIPAYLEKNPDLTISLLNLDTDIYEPAVVILNTLWDRMVKGGVLLLDDYATVHGETKAVDEFFKDKGVEIRKPLFRKTPYYIVK